MERVEPFIRSKECEASGENQMEEGTAAEASAQQEASVTAKPEQEEASEPEKQNSRDLQQKQKIQKK